MQIMPKALSRVLFTVLFALCTPPLMAMELPDEQREAFLQRAQQDYGLDPQRVLAVLDEAQYQPSIIELMNRPAEGKPWRDYRPIFVTDQRIQAGVTFWREHQDLLAQVETAYGVPAWLVVSIIGVETFYGRILGSHRVLDALATLGFHYPRRAEFFSKELLEFIRLVEDEGMPLPELKGSYAGAMGLGQFMPSSYRNFAVDFDADGRRDLWSSKDDIIASVANYFKQHEWLPGQPVVLPATVAGEAADLATRELHTTTSLAALSDAGVGFAAELPPETPASLLRLAAEGGDRYWVTLPNFYVITRYNRSPLYAMAVIDLGEAIRAARQTEEEA